MDTREGRETRVTSRIFWLITIVIVIITNNKTTTSMRRKGLKVIRGFYQYFNHYCHHYHHQQQGPLLEGTASAWKWYRCMEEQSTRWRHERGERQACPPPPLQCHVLSLPHYASCTITTTTTIIIVNVTMKENYYFTFKWNKDDAYVLTTKCTKHNEKNGIEEAESEE